MFVGGCSLATGLHHQRETHILAIVVASASTCSPDELNLSVMSIVYEGSFEIIGCLPQQTPQVTAVLQLLLVVLVRSVKLLIQIEKWTRIQRISDITPEPALVSI